jgi:hypothetical protein
LDKIPDGGDIMLKLKRNEEKVILIGIVIILGIASPSFPLGYALVSNTFFTV